MQVVDVNGNMFGYDHLEIIGANGRPKNIISTTYVPYTGAVTDVDLGTHSLSADYLEVSQSTVHTVTAAEIAWNSDDGTFDMGMLNGVTLQAGQEMLFYAKATEAISNGDAVQFAGAQGSHLLIKRAVPSEINVNPEYFVGVATQTFTTNQFGYVTAFGKVRNLDTLVYPEGTVLYFASGGATPGALTPTEPSAPNAKIIVAAVARSHQNQGVLFVRPHAMPKMEDIQDVNVTGATNGQVLTYNGSIWTPTTPTVGTVTAVTASAPLSSSGGTTPNISILRANTTTDGYLSAIDWNTFNNKQPAGNYITALSGEATGSGPGTAAVTLNNASVTAKVLTGVNVTGGSINASDSILTAFGKLQNQINGLIGSSIYQGTWNASTNTPTLTSGVGTRGYYYIVSVAGSTNLDGITDWNVGDWAIFDGTAWQQVDNTDSVTSVNGQTGAVSLTSDNIPEGVTNLYFTNLRARQALSLTTTGSSGAATYNNTTGVLNIPSYTDQYVGTVTSVAMTVPTGLTVTGSPITSAGTLALGLQSGYSIPTTANQSNWTTAYNRSLTAFSINYGTFSTNLILTKQDSSTLSLSLIAGAAAQGEIVFFNGSNLAYTSLNASAPLSLDPNNFTFSISQATTSTNGFLSSTDWNTFNNKQDAITLTTTGTSGPATLVGSTLNIPQYQSVITNPVTGTGTANYVARWTSSSNISTGVLYDNGTNVGIGTTSPAGLLHIYQPSGAGNFILSRSNNITGVNFQLSTDSTKVRLIGYGDSLAFFTAATGDGTNATEKMRITASGNVGIGTTSPSYKLHVYGGLGVTSTGYSFTGGDNTNKALVSITSSAGTQKYKVLDNTNTTDCYAHIKIHRAYDYGDNNQVIQEIIYQRRQTTKNFRFKNEGSVDIPVQEVWMEFYEQTDGHVEGWVVCEDYAMPALEIVQTGAVVEFNPSAGTPTGTLLQDTRNSTTAANWGTIQGNIYLDGQIQTDNILGRTYPSNTFIDLDYDETAWTNSLALGSIGSIFYLADTNENSLSTQPSHQFFTGTGDIDTATPLMTILTSGNVGIGTTAPAYKLDINDSSNIGLNLKRTINNNIGIRFANSGANNSTLYGASDAYALRYFYNSSEYLTINSTGNVGIGTASPTSKLVVAQSTSAEGISVIGNTGGFTAIDITGDRTSGNLGGFRSFRSGDAYEFFAIFPQANRSAVYFNTGDGSALTTTKLTILQGGNVGIGTTNPGVKLEVSGAIRVGSFPQSTTNSGEVWFGRAADRTLGTMTFQLGGSSASNTGFEIVDRAWTKVMYYFSGEAPSNTIRAIANGNVGIGTASPTHKLEVAGNIYVNAGNAAGFLLNGGLAIYRQNSNELAFNTNSTEKMRITSAGNILIGATSDIASTRRELVMRGANGSVVSLGNNTNADRFQIVSDSGENALLNNKASTPMILYTNNTERMRISNVGRVGINTSTPLARLHVSGDAFIDSAILYMSNDQPIVWGDNITVTGGEEYVNIKWMDFGIHVSSSESVGIGTFTPDPSAILDLTSTTKGFLPPRMTDSQMTDIEAPAAGLVVYDTANNKLTVYNGTAWVPLH